MLTDEQKSFYETFGFLVFRQNFSPNEIAEIRREFDDVLEEAAMIDGAGRIRILTSVILPNCQPVLATVAIFTFIAHWNDFFGPLIFLNSKENFTIPLGLYTLKTYAGDPGEPKDHLLMAGSVIATVPIIAIFFLAQRYFIRGIVTSGLKG